MGGGCWALGGGCETTVVTGGEGVSWVCETVFDDRR